MEIRKSILVLAVGLLLGATALAAGPEPAPILPKEFGGWQLSGSAKLSDDPAMADPTNAALLKEYGFTDFAAATYLRDDGRKLTIKAARFVDATGAYGAFTYYRLPQMLPEEIGEKAASLNERVLFYRGNILVDAVFQRLSAMSAAELRELASLLPQAAGGGSKAPPLPGYLPSQSRVSNSIRYVVGPVGLQWMNAPLPASLVDFNAGAEVVLADYNGSGGEATLMLISYPTPQIAAAHLRRIDAARQPFSPAGSAPLLNLGPFFDRRSGPILALVAGPVSQSEAQSLLASVNYDAEVTWNQNTYFDKKNNVANLLVNIILLCGVIAGLMIIAGIAFGGVRVLIGRLFPDRVFNRAEEAEFISLHLAEKPIEPRAQR
jgi:Family of unknown function (DUF6599)